MNPQGAAITRSRRFWNVSELRFGFDLKKLPPLGLVEPTVTFVASFTAARHF